MFDHCLVFLLRECDGHVSDDPGTPLKNAERLAAGGRRDTGVSDPDRQLERVGVLLKQLIAGRVLCQEAGSGAESATPLPRRAAVHDMRLL
jgi:hypothetical protein